MASTGFLVFLRKTKHFQHTLFWVIINSNGEKEMFDNIKRLPPCSSMP